MNLHHFLRWGNWGIKGQVPSSGPDNWCSVFKEVQIWPRYHFHSTDWRNRNAGWCKCRSGCEQSDPLLWRWCEWGVKAPFCRAEARRCSSWWVSIQWLSKSTFMFKSQRNCPQELKEAASEMFIPLLLTVARDWKHPGFHTEDGNEHALHTST